MEQGGMEAQGAVQTPMNPVAPVKEKKNNGLTIFLVLMMVLFAGAAVFFGIEYFKPKNNPTTGGQGGGSSTSVSEESLNTKMAEEYKDVKETMETSVSGINNDWTSTTSNSEGFNFTYKPDGLNTHVPMRFSLDIEIKNDDSGEAIVDTLKTKLIAAGFESIGESPILGSAGPKVYSYSNSTKDIVCGVYYDTRNQYEYGVIECGKTSWTWLTAEEKELYSELETAYYNKTGKYPELLHLYGGSIIKNSSVEPYQTIEVGTGGAMGLFYRKSADDQWQYFTSGHSAPDCSEYDTDDLKKAYAGKVCYDGMTELIVQP